MFRFHNSVYSHQMYEHRKSVYLPTTTIHLFIILLLAWYGLFSWMFCIIYDSLFAIRLIIWPRTLFLNSKTFLSTSNQIKQQKENVVMIPVFNWISVHIFKLGETSWLVNSDKENKNKTKMNPNLIWNWTHVQSTALALKYRFCSEESFFIRVNTLVSNQNIAMDPNMFRVKCSVHLRFMH